MVVAHFVYSIGLEAALLMASAAFLEYCSATKLQEPKHSRLYMHLTSPPFSTKNFHIKSASLGNTSNLPPTRPEALRRASNAFVAWDAEVVVDDVEERVGLHDGEPLVLFQRVSRGSSFLTSRSMKDGGGATYQNARADKRKALFVLDDLLRCSALRFHASALDDG